LVKQERMTWSWLARSVWFKVYAFFVVVEHLDVLVVTDWPFTRRTVLWVLKSHLVVETLLVLFTPPRFHSTTTSSN
jgi:hypothetical protein